MTPVTLDLVAYRRAPFIETPFGIEGDFSAATFAMQVRLYRDAPGDPWVDLGTATAGTEGISCAVVDLDGVVTSLFTVQIDQATIDAIQQGTPGGKAPVYRYDFYVTGGGLPRTRLFEGHFTVSGAVTQP